MNLLGKYHNGNYTVAIYDDGTKVRETDEKTWSAVFPECMDVKITDYCDMNCPYCHENSSVKGKHGDILSPKFIDSLRPFTEIAIGGGNPLSHPDLIPFLRKLKERNIIANITVNQAHFLKDRDLMKRLVKDGLVFGVGVSLTKPTEELAELLKGFPNAVLHVINGVVDVNDLKVLFGKGFKLLILGYKQFRKGVEYYTQEVEVNKRKLYTNMFKVLMGFDVVSFDNLAIGQLDVKRFFSTDEKWNEFYMGDDGNFTMFIDLVEQNYAKCSVATERFGLLDKIDDMFLTIKTKV